MGKEDNFSNCIDHLYIAEEKAAKSGHILYVKEGEGGGVEI